MLTDGPTAYSLGNPFPVYVSAAFCGDNWRINYDLYYVHDGVLLEGHKHDWEGVTVVFKPEATMQNWWYRDSMIYNKHGDHNQYDWGDIITVDVDVFPGPTDFMDETVGNKKKHGKVFVGFYSHAAFPDIDTSRLTDDTLNPDNEYRSNDFLDRQKCIFGQRSIVIGNMGRPTVHPQKTIRTCAVGNLRRRRHLLRIRLYHQCHKKLKTSRHPYSTGTNSGVTLWSVDHSFR